ncbi:MAG: YdcF family protein [Candidatus Dormibacteraeota bacterium]|nr:YdcF family protein [Candidatus Dormibacteraeota bacterium]
MRRVRLAFVATLAALIVAFGTFTGVTAHRVFAVSHENQLHRADAIVVLGAAQYDGKPSPILQARLLHALELYRAGLAPAIITSGGREPGDDSSYTEASVAAGWLIEQGVPASRVFMEPSGRTTWQSLAGVAAIGRARGFRTVILVTDPLASARAQQMALALGFQAAYVSPDSYLELSWTDRTKLEQWVVETLALMLYQVGLDRW